MNRLVPRSPLFYVGLAGILFCEVILFAAVQGLLHGTALQYAGRIIRANMTPLAWCCYLLLLLGLLSTLDGRSYFWRWRNRLVACWLWSVACWCYFDWMNFYFMRDPATGLRAWEYLALPPEFSDRLTGYLVAFGAICPGMFLTAEVFSRLGLRRATTPTFSLSARVLAPVVVVGVGLCLVPILVGGPISNLALWVGSFCLLDPINYALRRPSIFGDWSRGYLGRTLSLGLGGLFCGFLWEFWNYWATSKWVYHLPFLGRWEHIRYFEMPVPGLIGFIAFGIQTWVMWQTMLLVVAPLVEGEQNSINDRALARVLCL